MQSMDVRCQFDAFLVAGSRSNVFGVGLHRNVRKSNSKYVSSYFLHSSGLTQMLLVGPVTFINVSY